MTETPHLITDAMIHELAERQATLRPDALALEFEGKSETYSELNARANQVANALSSLGVKRGDRVVWLAQNLGSFWHFLLGAAKIGAVLTPINWRLAPAEISAILADANPTLVVGEAAFLDAVDTKDAVPADRIFDVDAAGDGSLNSIIDNQSTDAPDYEPQLEDAVIQLYTSGTTGLPKGVILSNAAYKSMGDAGLETGVLIRQSDDEAILHAIPHFHVAGVNFGMMALQRSMPITQHRQFDPAAIATATQGETALSIFLVPAMIMMVLEAAKKMQLPLTKISQILYGAAPMPGPLLEAAMAAMPDTLFSQFYGMTETAGGLSYLEHKDHLDPVTRTAAGKPLLGCEVKIVDASTGEEVPVGEVGEVLTRSGHLMDGYWQRPDATADAIKDGWYWSGDAGRVDENGFIYVVDRIKDMIISGGENIYPAELENALATHPAVLECAMVGAPDDKWGEIVKAFVVCRPGADVSADDVIEHLRERIASFKLPRAVEFLEALPRNPSGKILKTTLRTM